MRKSIKSRLIVSFMIVALLTVVIFSVVIRLTSGQSLMNLVAEQQISQLSEVVQNFYIETGSLAGFTFQNYNPTSSLEAPSNTNPVVKPPLPGNQPFNSRDVRGVNGLIDTNYIALMQTFEFTTGEQVPIERVVDPIAVKVDGEVVAWILRNPRFDFKLSPEEQLFLQRTNLAIGLAAGAGMLAAIMMGVLLAGSLAKPIRRLKDASKALSAGNLEQQVPVTSLDELGQLTATFNQMSADLAHADHQRKRLTADITHDLSTPLQIIAGYMEMLEDERVTLTPDRVAIIKIEIENLRRLVSDLTTLSQIEAQGLDIQAVTVDPNSLLEHTIQLFQPIADQQGVTLKLEVTKGVGFIHVDEGRTQQVLKNLMENALRYTPSGGTITLTSNTEGATVALYLRDNGSGIEVEDLPFVFDRFYRADKTRGGSSGKMGLGLAICKALVEAQGGTITANSEGLGKGTDMVLRFPIVGRTKE